MDEKILLDRLDKLEKKVKIIDAKEQICNQKNMFLHPMDFAMTRPDVSVQITDSEVFRGPEGVNKLFCSNYNVKDYAGIMLVHYLTSPAIEVAKDGKTARGTWGTPGIETVIRDKKAGPEAVWCFGSYANDFILENGVWKIWHMRFILVSKCNFKEGWVNPEINYISTAGHSKEKVPTHNPYSTTYTQESVPMVPKPYDTWNDEVWYMRQESDIK